MRPQVLKMLLVLLAACVGVATAEPPRFVTFVFVEETGRPGHTRLGVIDGAPPVGSAECIAVLSDYYQSVEFEIRTEDGQTIHTFAMEPLDESEPRKLYAEISIPSDPFQVFVSGNDVEGQYFEDVYLRNFAPQDVDAHFEYSGTALNGGSTQHLNLEVINHGETGTFVVFAVDDPTGSYVQSQPEKVEIETGGVGQFQLQFDVPESALHITPVLISAIVAEQDEPTRNNLAEIQVVVESVSKPNLGRVRRGGGRRVLPTSTKTTETK